MHVRYTGGHAPFCIRITNALRRMINGNSEI